MIIDSHCHIGPAVQPGEWIPLGVSQGTAENLVDYLEKHNIDMACGIPFIQMPINEANNIIANAAKKFPNKIIGFGTCNPWFKNAADTVKRSFELLGLKGLKLHPFIHGYALSMHSLTDPVYKTCADLGIPIVSHGGDNIFNTPYEFEEMARTFPEVTQVIVHMGSMYLCEQARLVAKRNSNISLDTVSALTYDIRWAVQEVGADKVIMGSDWPTGSTVVHIKGVTEAVSSKNDRNLILGGNIARILGLPQT